MSKFFFYHQYSENIFSNINQIQYYLIISYVPSYLQFNIFVYCFHNYFISHIPNYTEYNIWIEIIKDLKKYASIKKKY